MNDKRNDDLRKNMADDDVSKAIDDIFGNDFIELSVSNEESKPSEMKYENIVITSTDKLSNHEKSLDAINNVSSLKDNHNDNENENSDKQSVLKMVNTDKRFDSKTAILVLLLCILGSIIMVYILTKSEVNEESSVVCYQKIQTNDYDSTDEYVLNHFKDKLTYVSGTYVYKAKTENTINNIKEIKKDKLDVIINSNGIDGFTHTYEEGEESVLINSYYDMGLIDFSKIKEDEIKKLNEKEKQIIILRYFYGKTQSEIAQKLNTSQVQISRIEKNILLKMRENIKERL